MFSAGLLVNSKLLKILPSVWCNFSNLLKRNPTGKQDSCAIDFDFGIFFNEISANFSKISAKFQQL